MVQAISLTQAQWQEEFDRIALYSRPWQTLDTDKDKFSNGPSSYRDDSLSLLVGNRIFDNIRTLYEDQMEATRAALESEGAAIVGLFLSDYVVNQLRNFLDTGETEVGTGFEEQDASLNINPVYDGILGELIIQMNNAAAVDTGLLPDTSQWTVYGRIFGVNTDLYGDLYADWEEVSPGNYEVSLYKDGLKTELVAQYAGTDTLAFIDLAEENDSGITARCYFAYNSDGGLTVRAQRVRECDTSLEGIIEKLGSNAGDILIDNLDFFASLTHLDTIEVICIDGTLGTETFRVQSYDKGEADFNPIMHQHFTSINIGTYFDIKRVYTDDGTATALGLASWNITGETPDILPAGQIYGEAVVDGSDTIYNLYSDSARSVLVASGSIDTAAGGIINFTVIDGGIGGSVDVGGANPPGLFELYLNSPNEGDKWMFQANNLYDGYFDRFFSLNFGINLPAVPDGYQSIQDVAP